MKPVSSSPCIGLIDLCVGCHVFPRFTCPMYGGSCTRRSQISETENIFDLVVQCFRSPPTCRPTWLEGLRTGLAPPAAGDPPARNSERGCEVVPAARRRRTRRLLAAHSPGQGSSESAVNESVRVGLGWKALTTWLCRSGRQAQREELPSSHCALRLVVPTGA